MTKSEHGELLPHEQSELESLLATYFNTIKKDKIFEEGISNEVAIEQLQQFHKFEAGIAERTQKENTYKLRPLWAKNWMKYAASVIVLVSIGWATYYITKRNEKEPGRIAITQDIPAGTKGARLILADGRTIQLDSLSGQTISQGDAIVKNANGQLIYLSEANSQQNEIVYNTLATGRAETYSMTLADGSKIWVNAESSVRFPVSFVGNTREIEITGEVYLEVAHNQLKPFFVKANENTIQVLGTHFAVSAYDNEELIKTTLLEGKVKVISKNESVEVLKPGQQAQINKAGEMNVISDVDTQTAVSWKDGYFMFSGTNLQDVMRKLQRWYDVDVVYNGNEDARFYGGINRNLPLSFVLSNIEKMSDLKFTLEGRKIIVNTRK
ncbi:MAG TPA: FecR domain-containing protein [Cytophagaceae bacterium]